MAFIPALGILKVVQKMTWDGQEVRNIYHVDPNTGITPTVMALVTDLFWDWWDTSLQATLCSDLTLYEFEAIDMTTASSPSFPDIRTPAVGDNAQDSVPNNVALCVSWLTGLRGRSFRGRTYIPGISDQSFTGSDVGSSNAAAYAGVFDDLLADLFVAGMDLVVASYFTGGAPRAAALVTPIIEVAVNRIADSQRRRLPGRGT